MRAFVRTIVILVILGMHGVICYKRPKKKDGMRSGLSATIISLLPLN